MTIRTAGPRLVSAVVCGLFLGAAATTPTSGMGQSVASRSIPAHTPIEVQLIRHVPMKVGEQLRATLVYAIFADGEMILPVGSLFDGKVIALKSETAMRKDALLNADFTPYRRPVVRFSSVVLPDGTLLPISTITVGEGTPLIHLSASYTKKSPSLFGQATAGIRQQASSTKQALAAPGRGDRLEQVFFRLLPYHPQRIEQGTAWTCELADSVAIPASSVPHEIKGNAPEHLSDGPDALPPTRWTLHAYLNQEISSSTQRQGEEFRATVTEPVRREDNSIVVPQGALLIGTVTRVRPARSFGRAGVLRFDFRELQLPNGEKQDIVGSLIGADSKKGDNLQMDSEGGMKPKPDVGKTVVPIVLSILAARSLDSEVGQTSGAATGANGLGLIGTITGIAVSSRNLTAGIGFYGAALSVYRRWLRHGKEISFPKDNRVDIEISRQTGEKLTQN